MRATHQCLDVGEKLGKIERLGQIVISSDFQADDTVDLLVAGGEHENGRGHLLAEDARHLDQPGTFDWYDTAASQAWLGYQRTSFLRFGELLNADGSLNPMTSVAGQIKGKCLCALGEFSIEAVLSGIERFHDDFVSITAKPNA